MIRTESDVGIILLLDERFTSGRYRELFPIEWDDVRICSLHNVDEELSEFWLNKNKYN